MGRRKTSALNLLAGELERHEDVVTVRFNPWLFSSEVDLTRSFFVTLADVLGQRLESNAEKLGKVLEKCSPLASLVSLIAAGGTVTVDPGTGLKELGKQLSNRTIDQSRKQFEEILRREAKTVVVFVDDLDRLDRSDLHSMLRMVKLTAGFNHVVYVLAFDDEVAAAAIGHQYGDGGATSGQHFIEKIVQVPLALPPADPEGLREMVFDGINRILSDLEVVIAENDVYRFIRHFGAALQPWLTTPRQARRYVNAVEFAFPALKGEVDAVDQLLIEGIRVFHPGVYSLIRSSPDILIGTDRLMVDTKQQRERAAELILKCVNSQTPEQVEAVVALLHDLFPQLGRKVGGDELGQWSKEQRVAARPYFRRYFHYGIPPKDVPDEEIRRLLSLPSEMAVETIARIAQHQRSAGLLIDKLQSVDEATLRGTACNLILAIARSSLLFPDVDGILGMYTIRDRACRLVARLVGTLDSSDSDSVVAKVMESAEPPFAAETLRMLRIFELAPQAEESGSRLLADKLMESFKADPIYSRWPSDAGQLFHVLNRHSPDDLRSELAERLNLFPTDAPHLLLAFCGTAHGNGAPYKTEFGQSQYKTLGEYVDQRTIADAIVATFGKVDAPSARYFDASMTKEDRVVREFLYHHNQAVGYGAPRDGDTGY